MTRQYIIEIDDTDIIKLNNGHKVYRAKGFDTLVFNENGLKQLKTVSNNSSNNSGREEGYKEAMDTFEIYSQIVLKTLTERERFDLFGTADIASIFSQPLADNLTKVNDYLLKRIGTDDTNA